MFKNNKYTKWYFQIIENSKQKRILDYSEKHHIIPRCLGGSNNKNNIAILTAREHFICHLLLTKMVDDHRILFAFASMCRINIHQKRIVIKSHLYEYLRKCNSKASSIRNTGKKNNLGKKIYHNTLTGEENLFYKDPGEPWILGSPKKKASLKGVHKNKKHYYNPDTMQIIFISENDNIPLGFIKGNPSAKIGSPKTFKNSKYYYNPNTGEEIRSKTPIEGWCEGRAVYWITDGQYNKQISRNEIIPFGWYKGRTMKRGNTKWV